jgi:molecular chaperone DnaK
MSNNDSQMSQEGGSAGAKFAARLRPILSASPEDRWRLAASLGSGGMSFRSAPGAGPGSVVLVEFMLPDGRVLCRVAGRVLPPQADQAGVYLQLVDYDDDARQLVAAYRQRAERAQQDARACAAAQAGAQRAPPTRMEGARRIERLSARPPSSSVGGPVVGIDLGTTYSCVAVVENGRPRVLASAEGYETIPSVVFVASEHEVYVGHRAVQKMLLEPDKAIYGSKRFIGRPFTSREVKTYGHFFRYGLVADARGMAAAKLGERVIPLEAVAALILRYARQTASAALGVEVERCVITVPAYFGESQRRAVMQAGQMAGLAVERVVSEPTAAAVAYGYGRGLNKHVIVYDLGGGTFDASVLKISGDEMEVLATDGDPFLGGSDFDDRLTEYLCRVIERQHGIDIREDAVTVQRLRDAAEVAKRTLSQEVNAVVELPHLAQTAAGPLHFRYRLSREDYERLTEDLVVRSIQLVDAILRDAGLSAKQIDDIIMAGGQSRSPHIHRLITERFGKKPSMRVHPDHAIAIGASLVAAAAHGQASMSLTDILPASIHLDTGDRSGVILRRGQRLPARTKFEIEPRVGEDAEFSVTLYRGDHPALRDNELLGTVRLPSSLSEAIEGTTAIVVVDVSADGLLTLAMRHPVTGEVNSLQLSMSKSSAATDDIDDFEITVAE